MIQETAGRTHGAVSLSKHNGKMYALQRVISN